MRRAAALVPLYFAMPKDRSARLSGDFLTKILIFSEKPTINLTRYYKSRTRQSKFRLCVPVNFMRLTILDSIEVF